MFISTIKTGTSTAILREDPGRKAVGPITYRLSLSTAFQGFPCQYLIRAGVGNVDDPCSLLSLQVADERSLK